VYIGEQGKLPVITPSKLTPDLLFNFENGAYSYFSFKEVKPEKEVSKVAGGLQDGRVQTWYRLNRATVDAAGFTQFMKSVHANWLELGWEQEVKLLIFGSSQGLKPIADWIMLVKSTNALLLGHPCMPCSPSIAGGRFYPGHITPACTNNFPDKTSYWPLTEVDALVAKNHNNKKE